MRIRTLLALGVGAALGASATYLMDPDHGPDRRRDARTRAAERGREELATRSTEAVARAKVVAQEAVNGFREGASV